MSPIALRKTILAELAGYAPDGLSPAGLLELVRCKLPATTLGDITEELSWLRDHSLANYIASPLAPDDRSQRTWTITNAGQMALLK